VATGFLLVASVLIPIAADLDGDTANVAWYVSLFRAPIGESPSQSDDMGCRIIGGWSIASSISFSVAGSVSDIFGRRWTVISGEVFSVIGSVEKPYHIGNGGTNLSKIVASTAHTTLTVAAGSTIIGFGTGIVWVSYAGIQELVPNKWRGLIGVTELGRHSITVSLHYQALNEFFQPSHSRGVSRRR
jgi:MFS family permease